MNTSYLDITPGMIEIRVDSPTQVDAALDKAIGTVRNAAIRHHTGIMVTRTGPGQYTVRAHPAVPFGFIRQQHG